MTYLFNTVIFFVDLLLFSPDLKFEILVPLIVSRDNYVFRHIIFPKEYLGNLGHNLENILTR